MGIKNHKQYRAIEDQYMEMVAREISKEIDKEIIDSIEAEYLLDLGWHQSSITMKNSDDVSETAMWIHQNHSGDYRYVNGHWFFENPVDLTAFVLKFT